MFSRRFFLGAAALFALASCAPHLAPSARPSIRVVTFNIWHDKEWAARLPLLVQTLREADADVIALQEVLEDADKGLPNQAETIAQGLGGYQVHFFSTAPEGERRRYGNAILTRLPVIEVASKKLSPLSDHRTALRVRVDASGRPVDVVNTHLAWQADQGPMRAEQIADLLSWLPGQAAPLVLMGDFNAELPDSGLAAIDRSRFESALPAGAAATTLNTAKGHKPRVIDHIFVERRWFAVASARVIGDTPVDGIYASDHFGVAATLRWR